MHLIEQIWADPLLRQYYISAVLMAAPVARILVRARFKPWWAVLLVVPDIGLILCAALLAVNKWPNRKEI